MPLPKALFLDKASLFPDDIDFSILKDVANWQWFENANLNDKADDAVLHLADAEILVSNKVVLNGETIRACKKLKLICIAATGVNNVDLDAAKQCGVRVCNVQAYATPSVVQHVFSLILALNRKLLSYKQSALNGDWSNSDYFCYFGESINELEGKTLGIVGYGELGKAVADIAKSFGMNVLIANSHDLATDNAGRVDLDTLLSVSDVLTLHCPLTSNNHHMIDAQALSKMKPNAILINTARGGLVDEIALLIALKNNQLGAAGLDVLEQEPPAKDYPLINFHSEKLIVTPHIAWASRESRQCLINEVANNISAFQLGEQRNIV